MLTNSPENIPRKKKLILQKQTLKLYLLCNIFYNCFPASLLTPWLILCNILLGFYEDIHVYLINQVRGPHWEDIGPGSWQYELSTERSIQKRARADILPVRSRASLVNKGITWLFFGNIVYLRPRSVICGPSAKREGRKWHYKGANKQYSRKKSSHYHYYQ